MDNEVDQRPLDKELDTTIKVMNKASTDSILDEKFYNEVEFSEELSDGGERNEMAERQLTEE